MWSAISARLAEVIVGLMVAGVVVSLLVPVMGDAATPVLAYAVAVAAVTAVLWLARVRRRRAGERGGPRRED